MSKPDAPSESGLSRRGFLKGAGLGVAATTLIGSAKEAVREGSNTIVMCVANQIVSELGTGGIVAPVILYAPAAGISSEADHQRTMFAESLHAALTLDEIRKLVDSLNLAKSSVEQSSDRHWTWLAQR